MTRIAALAVLLVLSLSTASCASSPNWSGAETGGEFVWAPSPGPRFYVNAVLLGGLFTFFAGAVIQGIRGKDRRGIGRLSVLAAFCGLLLFANIRDFVWKDSFLINRSGIEHSYYTHAWIFPTTKKTDVLEWRDIEIDYAPHAILDHVVWDSLSLIAGESVDEGLTGRVIFFSCPVLGGRNCAWPDDNIKLVLQEKYFGWRPKWIDQAWSWLFGTADYNASPEEEARLKAAIRRLMPETLQQRMSPETRAYFQGRDAS